MLNSWPEYCYEYCQWHACGIARESLSKKAKACPAYILSCVVHFPEVHVLYLLKSHMHPPCLDKGFKNKYHILPHTCCLKCLIK
jgi:hypothetical protein